MGNTLATTQSNNVVSKEYDVDKKTFQLVFDKAIRLHKKHRSQFLDRNFCDKLSITSSKELLKLPIDQVRKVYNKIEGNNTNNNVDHNNLNIQLKYDTLSEEKFLVNTLRGRLNDYFKNKKIRKVDHIKGVSLIMPDIYYIQKRTLNLFNDMKRQEINKNQRGGRWEW